MAESMVVMLGKSSGVGDLEISILVFFSWRVNQGACECNY